MEWFLGKIYHPQSTRVQLFFSHFFIVILIIYPHVCFALFPSGIFQYISSQFNSPVQNSSFFDLGEDLPHFSERVFFGLEAVSADAEASSLGAGRYQMV